ncbi:MAG: trigger factor [Frankia sp.]
MKATKETLSPTRVKITVEVPFDELKPSVDAAYRKLAKQVRISGFRPGKVPPRVLDQRVGRGVVLDEALQEALPRFYSEAVQAERVDVLSRPEVDITDFTDGAPLVFTAEVDVRPEVSLPDYDGLEVVVDKAEVTDEQIDEQLESMRDRHAVLKPVERPVAEKDFVSIDLAAAVDGENVEGAEATGMSYEVGSGNLISGLDEALVGAAEGETRTFETELLAGEHKGDTAEVTVTVRGVKEKELPALDDDFATTASEFDSLDELKADVRSRLEQSSRSTQVSEARDKALEALVGLIEVPLPASVVDSEIEARQHQLGHQLERFGMSHEDYLAAEDKTAEQFDTEVREGAEKAIRAQFVLDQVIEAEQIQLGEGELMQQIVARAQRSGLSPEQYAQQLAQSDQITAVMADVLRGKALSVVLDKVRIVDTDGTPVELPVAVEEGFDDGGLDDDADDLDALDLLDGDALADDHAGHDHHDHDHHDH